MKKRKIIFGVIITIGGIAAYGFINKTEYTTEDVSSSNSVLVNPPDSGKSYFDLEVSSLKKAPKKQQLFYMVRGFTNQGIYRPITQEKIKKAKFLKDIIENYPSNWISDYNSVTVSTAVNGKEHKATGLNPKLTKEQKSLFNTAEISSTFHIEVNYQKKNDEEQIQNRKMSVDLIVTPKTEAKYSEGYEQLIAYFEENSKKKILTKNITPLSLASISFIINKNGETENIILNNSYKDSEIDNLLVKLIKTMPKWIPAKNAQGQKVKQKFVLEIGPNGC